MDVIRVRSAFKSYKSSSDSKDVLTNFNMTIKKGSIFALMGSSGCGKTTLISCIVGSNQLDSGDIEVFGEGVGKNNSIIGCMPQETSLIKEMTIKETFHLFGSIYGMTKVKVEDRLEFFMKLLDLPDRNRMIVNCSGGQQRRVSFAVALIHEPEILILDEPTVGVDPLLRDKIWKHLVEITSTKNATVMMTTHYIEEARSSTHIALLRKGVLLVQDTPVNLLAQCETDSLEEAFLKLSQQQEQGQLLDHGRNECMEVKSNVQSIDRDHPKVSPSSARKLRALVKKNIIQFKRNPGSVFLALLLPIVGILCIHNTSGTKLTGLKVGIINEEVNSPSECFNKSLETFSFEDDQCFVNKISCNFIRDMNDFTTLSYYDTIGAAENQVRKGNIYAYIHFNQNFSAAFPLLLNRNELDASDDGNINVLLDASSFQVITLLQRNLYDVYKRFAEKLMIGCGYSKRTGTIPMKFETFNGLLDDDFVKSLAPGLIISSFFAVSTFLTAVALIEDRQSGIWDRALTAGATPNQFLISRVIVSSAVMIFQAVEYMIYAIMIDERSHHSLGYLALIAVFLVTFGFSGMLFGFCVSILTDSLVEATYFTCISLFPFLTLAGIYWPIEGIAPALQTISKLIPFTLTSRTFKNILFSEFKFSNPIIYSGFIVIAGWVFGQSIICFWFLRSHRQKKN